MLTLALFAGTLMTLPDKVILSSSTLVDAKLPTAEWGARQGTRWSFATGVVEGRASAPEYQASKKDHKGLEPRLALPTTPQDFAAEFDIRFSGGTWVKLAPFIEFGHHKARFSFTKEALTLDADSGKAKLGTSKEVKYRADHWYHVIAEQKGEDVLIQVDGARLFGTHPSLLEKPGKGAAGLGICGLRGGTVQLKNLNVWSIKPEAHPAWASLRLELSKPKG